MPERPSGPLRRADQRHSIASGDPDDIYFMPAVRAPPGIDPISFQFAACGQTPSMLASYFLEDQAHMVVKPRENPAVDQPDTKAPGDL